MPYKAEVRDVVKSFRERLMTREKMEMMLLAREWNRSVIDKLRSLIADLSALEAPSKNQLFELEKWKQFLAIANRELNAYAEYSAVMISNEQREFGVAGISMAQSALNLYGVNYAHLNVSAVNEMIGRSFMDGSPLRKVLEKRYGDSLDRVARTLVESTALGRNPVVTARLIGEDLTGSFYNTLRIARTEQLEAFRESTRDQYMESGIVKGIDLIASPDACEEICLPLVAKNPHPIDYPFDELHPNCRCAYAPSL